MNNRRDIIKRLCSNINSPGLIWAFSDPGSTIDTNVISDFRLSLLSAFNDIVNNSQSHKSLPNNTDLFNLPAFVAMENPPNGVEALFKLGYRPSWNSPELVGEKYEVVFTLPNNADVKFLTGPNGSFSVYSLWLQLRILCAQKGEVNKKVKSENTNNSHSNDLFSAIFNQRY